VFRVAVAKLRGGDEPADLGFADLKGFKKTFLSYLHFRF
jgi:hypothetical protein